MKKLLIAAALAAVAVIAAMLLTYKPVRKDYLNTGVLGYLGTTEKEFQEGFDEFRNFIISSDNKDNFEKNTFFSSLIEKRRVIHFYDSLMALMMDLRAARLDEIILPESVAQYLLSHNNFYKNVFSIDVLKSGICFGFTESNKDLCASFDNAIKDMEADGTLEKLKNLYVENFNERNNKPMRPDTIAAAEELRVAVTGDMPPIDMFAGDGKPMGYNTAILSEIGKRLGKNISFVNTDAGGRSAALTSGRADVVFWYRATKSNIEGQDPFDDLFRDVPEGIILSVPYYLWDNEFIIRMKENKGILDFLSSEE